MTASFIVTALRKWHNQTKAATLQSDSGGFFTEANEGREEAPSGERNRRIADTNYTNFHQCFFEPEV